MNIQYVPRPPLMPKSWRCPGQLSRAPGWRCSTLRPVSPGLFLSHAAATLQLPAQGVLSLLVPLDGIKIIEGGEVLQRYQFNRCALQGPMARGTAGTNKSQVTGALCLQAIAVQRRSARHLDEFEEQLGAALRRPWLAAAAE